MNKHKGALRITTLKGSPSGFTLMNKVLKETLKGFTLIEMLIVIAMIAIISVMAVAIYSKTLVNARDGQRLSDFNNLFKAIFTVYHNSNNLASDLCFNTTSPCQSSSYPKGANTSKIDGTGWVKINFSANALSALPNLPIDPTNNSTYNYTYYSDGINWKISTVLESADNAAKMSNDGGTDPQKYELGSDLKALP